ncbi:STAS domain-containing protein [Streptosporangium sandarakinum]|uniref:STAS domain-containing protein n=1 Tax=Streptosporangium TaxID=2000 RepID=UPI0031F8B11A
MSTAVHVSTVPDDAVAASGGPAEGVSLLAVSGELDYTNAERFRHDLLGSIGSDRQHLVIDLAGLSFCDSTGIRVFLAIRKLVQDRGGNLAIADPHPRIRRIFHLTGLTNAFAVHPTVEEAVGFLRRNEDPA